MGKKGAAKSTPMTKSAAARIGRANTSQGFKGRAAKAAVRNAGKGAGKK